MCLPLLPYMVTPITKRTSPLNSHQKTTQNIYNTYGFASIAIYGHSDHKTNITIEFTSKNHSRTYITLMGLPLLPYMVTLITKQTSPLNSHQKTTQNIYNTYGFASIAIYGHSDHKTNITIEFTSKNQSKTYITLMGLPLLPYMVTPITKQTSPLNSHQKTTQNIYNTYGFAVIAIYGHSDHKTNITIEFTSKNHSRTHRTLMCLPLLPYMVTPITKRTSPLNSH